MMHLAHRGSEGDNKRLEVFVVQKNVTPFLSEIIQKIFKLEDFPTLEAQAYVVYDLVKVYSKIMCSNQPCCCVPYNMTLNIRFQPNLLLHGLGAGAGLNHSCLLIESYRVNLTINKYSTDSASHFYNTVKLTMDSFWKDGEGSYFQIWRLHYPHCNYISFLLVCSVTPSHANYYHCVCFSACFSGCRLQKMPLILPSQTVAAKNEKRETPFLRSLSSLSILGYSWNVAVNMTDCVEEDLLPL